jgi:hypothetical protein
MAETLISPGVLARENDASFISRQPIAAGAAIIGPTVKGPVNKPTLISTYNDYQNKFGTVLISGSDTYTYFTSIAAYNYFNNGGQTLLVTRVVNGNYSPASSSGILNNVSSTPGAFATGSVNLINPLTTGVGEVRLTGSFGLYRFIATTNAGTPADDVDGNLYYFVTQPTLAATATSLATVMDTALTGYFNVTSGSGGLTFVSTVSASTYNGVTISTGSGTTFSNVLSIGGGADGIGSIPFILETISEGVITNSVGPEDAYGALASGSKDNIRWQIVNSDTDTGTFDLLIRRGDDITNDQVVLETWTGLSLDPTQDNFIAKTIGDQIETYNPTTNQMELDGFFSNASQFVRVKQVNYLTPNYFDNTGAPKVQYQTFLPTNASGAFGGAIGDIMGGANFYHEINGSNTQGLIASDYDDMIDLLSNQDDYIFNVMMTPGLVNALHASQITTLITNTQQRGDNIYVVDMVPYGSNVNAVVAQASSRNTSYASTYWPWTLVFDPDTGDMVWTPASTVIGGVYAYNDNVAEPWFAPAGINRGGLSQVVRAEQKLPQSYRDSLYNGKVNPIATFPSTGVVVYGQKTLQTRASALDRVNVRRLLIALKTYISQVAQNLVFEQNTIATRNNFLSIVTPYLESVQQRQGLYAFKVVMDDSNNTADVIDRNQLVGNFYLQPTKTAEFIYLNFNITPTGATFPA